MIIYGVLFICLLRSMFACSGSSACIYQLVKLKDHVLYITLRMRRGCSFQEDRSRTLGDTLANMRCVDKASCQNNPLRFFTVIMSPSLPPSFIPVPSDFHRHTSHPTTAYILTARIYSRPCLCVQQLTFMYTQI